MEHNGSQETLNGKIAIVTGGGTGIGRSIALALGREGVKVATCGRRPEPLAQTAAEIQAAGGTALAIPADVSQEGDVERLVSATVAAWGPLDILINNAGIGSRKQVHQVTAEEWDEMMAINLRGPFLLMRAVLPAMRERRQGHIINISSEAGLEFHPGSGVYGVSKHALNALAEFVQRENQSFGIRVNTICPSLVYTEAMANVPRLNKDNCLQPADMSDMVLWLLRLDPRIKIGRPILAQMTRNPWQ
jgi:NAD(P)-dependent dehydrogenase (short-subunit alcohol dehydrogenase family)